MLSALYYIFTLLQVTVLFVVSILVLIITYPFDKSRRWVHECSRLICALLYGVPFLMRRTIDGVENIDKNKAYVMVLNHNSGFDIFVDILHTVNGATNKRRHTIQQSAYPTRALVYPTATLVKRIGHSQHNN